jgi:NadR type nicotinamide-nucleotide adenylyltransferase
MTRPAPIRVVLTGSESTGKTVLARELAARYDAELVAEFSRDYAAGRSELGSELGVDDVEPIARGQMARESAHAATAAARGARIVIQDTDLLSTAVYAAHYYDARPAWLADAVRDRRPDLYLLLEIDVPWVADDVRDRGERREEVQGLFRDAVAASGAPYVVIRGGWDERRRQATDAIDRLLAP